MGRARAKSLVAALTAVVFGVVLVAGCGGGGGASANRGDITIAVVTHGQASDPFWSVVKNGVDQAADDMGVEVRYNAPETFDMVKMGQLIDAAVASEPDGLAVSVPDPAALEETARRAGAFDVRVVTEEFTAAMLGWPVRTFEAAVPPGKLGMGWAMFAYRSWQRLSWLDRRLSGVVPRAWFYNALVTGVKGGPVG